MSREIRIIDAEKPEPRGVAAYALRIFVMLGVWALVAIAAVAVARRFMA